MLRRQITIHREGWYYLAITAVVFGGAMFKGVNLLLILSGMLLGPLLLNWRAVTTNLRRLRVERKLPLGLSAGDPLSVGLTLVNGRQRLGAWAIVAEEQIRRVTANHTSDDPQRTMRPSVLFTYVPAGQSRKGAYRGRLPERGRYAFGPLRLTTRFPFGLFSQTLAAGGIETMIVLPRLGWLREGWAARRIQSVAGASRRTRPGNEGDFYGVREWRSGDGQRLIHWRSSARLGKPVVRQFERPRNTDIGVTLDLWQPQRPTSGDLQHVELAVSFAATLLADLCRKGGCSAYLASSNSAPECCGGPASSAVLQSFMERLATVEAQSDDTLPALLEVAMRQIPASAEIVLASTRPIDLSDKHRFAMLWSTSALRQRIHRMRVVDASSTELSEFFQVPGIGGPETFPSNPNP